jgi:hypothetical protein
MQTPRTVYDWTLFCQNTLNAFVWISSFCQPSCCQGRTNKILCPRFYKQLSFVIKSQRYRILRSHYDSPPTVDDFKTPTTLEATTMAAQQQLSYKQYTETVQPLLNFICRRWNLKSPMQCLPHLMRPYGKAETWSPDMLYHLARLSLATSDDQATAVRELRQVWHLRLGKYPESNPDLCAQDVETVYKRRRFMNRAAHQEWEWGEYEPYIPRLDVFPSPPSWKKRKLVSDAEGSQEAGHRGNGKGPVRFDIDRLVQTPRSAAKSVDLEGLTPISKDFQKPEALYRRSESRSQDDNEHGLEERNISHKRYV